VKDLAGAGRVVAAALEVHGERDDVGAAALPRRIAAHRVAEVRPDGPDARVVGADGGEERRARGAAQGVLAVGGAERDGARSEPRKVRRLDVLALPVRPRELRSEVIDADHQDVDDGGSSSSSSSSSSHHRAHKHPNSTGLCTGVGRGFAETTELRLFQRSYMYYRKNFGAAQLLRE
jgi:hypothetical protein